MTPARTARKIKPGTPEDITTIIQLRKVLQTALEVEHSTIPPYLCALYSIKEGANQEAANLIRSVVMEEMLHMILVANVLNAIGGKPDLTHAGFIPKYPTYLRHSNRAFVISLEKFSRASVATFMKIEKPQKLGAPVEANQYETLGQLYGAIIRALKYRFDKEKYFDGDVRKQVTPDSYYGGGGRPVKVTSPRSARLALHIVTDQGEGIKQTISDGDKQIFGGSEEYAHYFRFNEIYRGRYYKPDDTPQTGPRGTTLPVDWEAVYNMRPNPKLAYYPKGSEVWVKSIQFCRTYRTLLKVLQDALNGEPQKLMEAVAVMYELKHKAVSLMKLPIGEDGMTAGPSFEYIPGGA